MTDQERADAFVQMAAETGLVLVARDVYDQLKAMPSPIKARIDGGIEIAVSDLLEPGDMMAIRREAPINYFDLGLLLE